MENNFKKYIAFWLSQAVSQLGSQMTGFALILWSYSHSGSAMTVSLMTFFNYLPYIAVSIAAGAFVDSHRKKSIMLVSDSLAAFCSASVLFLSLFGGLRIYHIYAVNFIIGLMNAFQGPASAVAVGKMLPKEKLAQAGGMNSFSDSMVTVFAPVVGASLYAFGGLKLVLLIDLLSFAAAFSVLLLFIKIPQDEPLKSEKKSAFYGCREGFSYLSHNRAVLTVIVTMAFINFFSRLTYENILSPMILARSGNDSMALGVVNAFMGIGGIAGGAAVATGKFGKNSIKMIYFSAMLSFLTGDLTMAVGRNAFLWSFAGLMASLPIPFINTGQNVFLYNNVPAEIQGRVFSVRNAVQFSTVPVGILLGGFLADYIFEPFMKGETALALLLKTIVGGGNGSGMAVMFLCTGILGGAFSFMFYRRRDIQAIK